MNLNRRFFLKRNILTTIAAGIGLSACNEPVKENATSTKKSKNNPNSLKGFPLAIATWAPNTKATAEAMSYIEKGKIALDAVEAGAKIPEADPEDTSVGYGGFPDRDGNVTLDACIMDTKGNTGAVTCLQHIKHPISVARLVMEKTPHVMLTDKGALEFALSQGFEKENLLTEKAKKAWEEWKIKSEYKPVINVERHDTIGLLAMDKQGNISGACSTSGAAFKMHGRIGDSPIIGAGLFVDNEIGAACATGLGEYVVKTLGSFLMVELMRQGATPQEACEEAISRVVKKYPNYKEFQIGYLAINKAGEHGAFSIQKGFNYALFQNQKNQVFEADYYMK